MSKDCYWDQLERVLQCATYQQHMKVNPRNSHKRLQIKGNNLILDSKRHAIISESLNMLGCHLGPSDVNFVTRWWAQRYMQMFACAQFFCDSWNSSTKTFHQLRMCLQADLSGTSKKYNRKDYSSVVCSTVCSIIPLLLCFEGCIYESGSGLFLDEGIKLHSVL